MMKIYHNPKCSKSRQAIDILEKNNVKYQIIEYLKETPEIEELEALYQLFGMEMLRQKEEDFKPFKGQEKSAHDWAEVMHSNPKLIERPIIIKSLKEAVIGRPTDRIFDII